MLFTAVTFILLLLFGRKETRAANRFLAAALAIAVLWIARILAIDIQLESYVRLWSLLPMQFSLALGPFVFFYVLKTTQPEYQFRRADLLHFGPLLLELSVYVMAAVENIKTGVPAYRTQIFQQLNPVLQLLAFISVAIYLYRSRTQIELFYRQQKFTGSDRLRYGMRWLHNLITGLGLLWLLWIPLTAADYFYYHHTLIQQAYFLIYFLLLLMMIWMAANTFLRPELSTEPNAIPVLKPLLPAGLKEKAVWLKRMVKDNRYYEDPELSLSSLAQKLDVHTHELSRIINTVLKKNFNDFINEYRVQTAARKMQDPANDHITLLGIAFESGFNSQSSFNRIFKQIAGKSPQEYKNDLKKQQSTYNMGIRGQAAPVILNRENPSKWYHDKLTRNYMFKNYFKIAWRNLVRHKSYTAINIAGLAVGIAICMVIFIIIQYQTSFDNFHPAKERTYRLLTEYHRASSADISYGKDLAFPIPLGLKTTFPEIEQIAPVYASQSDQLLILDNNGKTEKVFKEQRGLFYTDPAFFKIFNFPLLAGSYASLTEPNNVLLTKEIAEKYFGDWKTAIGKTIKLQAGGFMFSHSTDVLKVTGILATIPPNTDFRIKLAVSYQTFYSDYVEKATDWNRTEADFGCYVLLPPNVNADSFNQQLKAYSQKVLSPDNHDRHVIQPLSDVHYDTRIGNYSNQTISHQLINVLWLIAAFILLIACVNFINLSTAQAVNRSKEVGVRKVLGSSKTQLQIQFIIETFLIVAASVSFATIVTIFTLPFVNRLLELSLTFNIINNPAIILFLLTVTITVTALAGFYPSIVLSRFNPVNALKSKLTSNNSQGISLRRGLVVFQFIIAQALIIGTLVIVRQMNYFMDQPLGFDKDAIVNIPFRVDSLRISRLDYLKRQLLSTGGVQEVSYSSNTPVEAGNDQWSTLRFDHAQKDADFKAITKFADDEYVAAYKLPLIAGRNLQPSKMTREFLVNEAFVKSLGLKKPEEILKEISIWNGQIKCPVVGVLKDFNNRSFRNYVAPLLITTNVTMYNQAGIKLATTHMASTMQSVKEIFEQNFPDFVYEYQFLDDKIAGFYKQESQLAQLYKIFSAVAILLSCLGLYGLASFMAVQRVKEVGIRKVLGATAGSIVYLFSKEFIILIAIAFAIATPIAWYYMHQWLQAYVYRINISWWLFAAGGISAIIIALTTISFQAVKAARVNPVKSLRSE
ncbi:FtsX-like permease family protein [Mucilaginibacter celer]|uniref:FtsX-like permease family protein n=2 Tax=Mucilaginibacter celer TaxID=2305508 RepID=A0A494W3Q3_9SPHI|nr:FtsX-like permease family protein [Mucilaginibacter celer]